MTLFGQFI